LCTSLCRLRGSGLVPGTNEARDLQSGGVDSFRYWITQPYIAWHYYRSFFWPDGPTADSDFSTFEVVNAKAIAGMAFVLLLFAIAWIAPRRADFRPVSFGLFWFIIALFPTAVMPLAEVENDHRMFFAFAGLAFAVSWAAMLASRRIPVKAVAAIAGAVLILCAIGTWQRNAVWHTEETLWRDAALKSPRNGRALMNYADEQGRLPNGARLF
jgi:hypothetical protein